MIAEEVWMHADGARDEPAGARGAPGAARTDVLRAAAHDGKEPDCHDFDRYPEQTAALKRYHDLFGAKGRKQLAALEVSAIDRIQIDRSLAFIDDIAHRIKECERTIKTLSKGNANVQRLQTLPGIGEFFARLIDAEIDDIARFRSASKLATYAGLVPSTYSSGGKTFHGRIIKQGNKWLRWAFVEPVAPAVFSDLDKRA
jgi:transposase